VLPTGAKGSPLAPAHATGRGKAFSTGLAQKPVLKGDPLAPVFALNRC